MLPMFLHLLPAIKNEFGLFGDFWSDLQKRQLRINYFSFTRKRSKYFHKTDFDIIGLLLTPANHARSHAVTSLGDGACEYGNLEEKDTNLGGRRCLR